MKILRVITRLNIGGPAIQALDLTNELSKRGHECRLLSGISPKEEGCMWTKYKDYVPVRFQGSLKREPNLKQDYYTFRAIRRAIKEFKPDIIHTHMSKAGALARLAALTILKRPKLIHTYHGHTFHSYFGKTRSFIYRSIERFLAKFTDKIIVISRSQHSDIVYQYKIAPENKVELIKLGFDLDKLLSMRDSDGLSNGIMFVGIIGRITDIKDHFKFLDFMEALIRSENWRIRSGSVGYIIGDGDEEIKKKLKAEIDMRELPVQITGWQDVMDWYPILDIVVCTSKNEGTPVSLIEAMAAGRLVISTPVGGVIDLLGTKLSDKKRGMILTDVNKTVKDLEWVIKSGYYKELVSNAREYVRKEYQLKRLVDDVEELYQRVMEE